MVVSKAVLYNNLHMISSQFVQLSVILYYVNYVNLQTTQIVYVELPLIKDSQAALTILFGIWGPQTW